MNALVICSVHALFDLSPLERKACNAVLERFSIPSRLSDKDHATIRSTTTMLELLNHMPGSSCFRDSLVEAFLEALNEEIWTESIRVYESVHDVLMEPHGLQRPTGFVSEYPLLTTNLVRAAALLTHSTRLGSIVTPTYPMVSNSIVEGLGACAETLDVPPHEIEVMVARRCDFAAAQSIGMRPRFVAELQRSTVMFGLSGKPQIREAFSQFPEQEFAISA